MALPKPPKASTLACLIGLALYTTVVDFFSSIWHETKDLSKSHLGRFMIFGTILLSPLLIARWLYHNINETLIKRMIASHM